MLHEWQGVIVSIVDEGTWCGFEQVGGLKRDEIYLGARKVFLIFVFRNI